MTKLLLKTTLFGFALIFASANVTTWGRYRKSSAKCDGLAGKESRYAKYFQAMKSIYKGREEGTCLPFHLSCGWPKIEAKSALPLFVLSVGLEGAGHHMWTEILAPVFDCVWINGRHYQRNIADGVPRMTSSMLAEGFRKTFRQRAQTGQPACNSIYDAQDSFPTGAIQKSGRAFMRPDLVNLQALDGVLFNIKYLLILRNVTDAALSALRRNFFTNIDAELRTVEHMLSYIEAAMKGIECDRTFIAHYEHVLAHPLAYLGPISDFLELTPETFRVLETRLNIPSRKPSRKPHQLTWFPECNSLSESTCYEKEMALTTKVSRGTTFMEYGLKGVQSRDSSSEPLPDVHFDGRG